MAGDSIKRKGTLGVLPAQLKVDIHDRILRFPKNYSPERAAAFKAYRLKVQAVETGAGTKTAVSERRKTRALKLNPNFAEVLAQERERLGIEDQKLARRRELREQER